MSRAASSISPRVDTSFAAISRAPLANIEPFKRRMGWTFPWISSFANDFNDDFHVTVDPDKGAYVYNYASVAALVKAGKMSTAKGEMPGLGVFLRDGNSIFHTYSTYQRALDLFLNPYNLLDLTPLGRQEEKGQGMVWLRHHARYFLADQPRQPVAISGGRMTTELKMRTASKGRAVTDGDTVLATTDVAAPPEHVFSALNTDEVERWWGSADTYRMTQWRADVRVGGQWHVGVRGADGITLPAGGEFLHVDAPRKVVFTRKYEWDFPLLGRRETPVAFTASIPSRPARA